MSRRISTLRPRFEPICTTPWTGSSTAGGSSCVIAASIITPPPRPSAPVSAEVKKDRQSSARAEAGATPGGTRSERMS
ncbi:MAG: hypothetical protein FJX69_07340 [Alphaproteobacteria bacterium]|nr:hypothetical protein [Alphaproteobacteria bacterium]